MIVDIGVFPVSPAATGYPGGTAGWGGTITYTPDYPGQPTQYALFTGVDFDTITPVGTFTPFFASTQFVMLVNDLAGTTWSETYDSSIPTGIGQIEIFPDVPAGAFSAGTLIFYYDLYSANPFTSTDPDILIGTGYSASAFAYVQVLGNTEPDPVPEPASAALVGLGLAGVVAIRHRFGRKSR